MFTLNKSGSLFYVLFGLLLVIVIAMGCAVEPDKEYHEGYEESPRQENSTPGDVPEDTPETLFASSTGDIHDYMPDLIAGRPVSGYELLPCLENFTRETWSELDKSYGLDWWNPLWTALQSASINNGPSKHDYEEQSLRNYYLGKAFLASDGAYSESLTNILKLQWDYDKALYSSSLSEHFSDEEEDMLRRFLTYSFVWYNDDTPGLYITDESSIAMRPLYLDTYPVDFPFCIDLTENSRDSFQAESFGLVNQVESDNLQVTYLNPYEGVYTVITIRSMKNGCSAGGVAIGDSEEMLLEGWQDKPLEKLDRISYDDEAWFGDEYDFAYVYSQEGGTKSTVFLIKNSIACGIELIDGLDGAMY